MSTSCKNNQQFTLVANITIGKKRNEKSKTEIYNVKIKTCSVGFFF